MRTIAEQMLDAIEVSTARNAAMNAGSTYANYGGVEVYYFWADGSALVIICNSVMLAGKGRL